MIKPVITADQLPIDGTPHVGQTLKMMVNNDTSQRVLAVTKTYIKVRTEFEGFHFYPEASKIDPRIAFLEAEHRHIFKVEVKISVTHLDRELEFFLVKWSLQDFIKDGRMNHKSCEMMATDILQNHLIPKYGVDRYYEVVVSEDNESDGIVEYTP